MDETLEKALNSMFNLAAPEGNAPAAPNTQTVPEQQVDTTAKELAGKANELFKKAKDAQQSGNWSDYGEYLKQLEDVLNQLNKAVE